MKLFGLALFERKKGGKLYDFAQHGLIPQGYNESAAVAFYTTIDEATEIAEKAKGRKKKVEKPQIKLTPKEIYQLSSLNDNNFKLAVDDVYLEEAIGICKQKLSLLPPRSKDRGRKQIIVEFQDMAVKYGRDEIESIIERLENRRKIKSVQEIVEKYPHTSTALINTVLKDNKHLRFEKAEKFVPDFPVEAIEAMKEYTEMCQKLCGKEAVFYVVAQEKDFKEVNNRRDPILLAQSPFGFFWQVLGAWDEEMVYLDEL